MTDLNEYLGQKRPAFRALKAAAAKPDYAPTPLRARVTAEGRSGIRRIRIRDFQVLSDSPPSFVGYDIGPSSPELALGALGSCVTHSFLIQAAVHELPLDNLEVEVTGRIDARAGIAGHEDSPSTRMTSPTPCASSRPPPMTRSRRCARRSSGVARSSTCCATRRRSPAGSSIRVCRRSTAFRSALHTAPSMAGHHKETDRDDDTPR